MNNKLYKLMNWPEIEAVVYAESDKPNAILGPHSAGASTLYQVFIPDAKEVRLRFPEEDKSIKMEQVDENGYFALLHTGKAPAKYEYIAEFASGKLIKLADAYRYDASISKDSLKAYQSGRCEDAYKYIGAHVQTINGCEGTLFSIWAPNARRVSVVGEFCNWDGRMYQMSRIEDTGIYSIFIPGVKDGDSYLFEINTKAGLVKEVLDPLGTATRIVDDRFVSVVHSVNSYTWNDDTYMSGRDKTSADNSDPMAIYKCNLASLVYDKFDADYATLGKQIAAHAKELGYTHVELAPIAEYEKEASAGYETVGFYAPTYRYGKPEGFAELVDILHQHGLKVILDWTLAHPSSANYALRKLDGTGCYEHEDPRQGIHPEWGTLLFNYARGEVISFLRSNAFYWLDVYHIDGLRIDSLAPILCLDYGRASSDWIPNVYGGHENLDAVDFIKKLNITIEREYPGVITIAEDSSAWQMVTEKVSDGGLGFSYKWNIGWRDDYLRYIEKDPLFRGGSHNDLTLSMVYCYSDRFVLPFSVDEITDPRLSISYMYTHPGAKLIQAGLDTDDSAKGGMEKMVKALNALYLKTPALYELDDSEDGFEWINCMDYEGCTLSYIRKGRKSEDALIVVANFAGIDQVVNVGVNKPGKYIRVFNSDASTYGGSSKVKSDPLYTIDEDYDSKPYYIPVSMPELSLSIFKYEPFDENDREYMLELQQEAKKKADEAKAKASKEEAKAKAAQKKAEAEQKKAEEAARIAEEARIKAEKEYKKAEEELEKAYKAMEKAKEAAAKAELAAHRLEITEASMKK